MYILSLKRFGYFISFYLRYPSGHVTQLIFFCYANKIFVTQKSFFATCFFSVPISKFFVSFIILICNPVFYLIYLCYSIFFVSNVVFCFCLKHWKFSCYWFFEFLILLYIKFVFSFLYVYQFFLLLRSFFSVSYFFMFLVFYCYSTFLNITHAFLLPYAFRIFCAGQVLSTFISDLRE